MMEGYEDERTEHINHSSDHKNSSDHLLNRHLNKYFKAATELRNQGQFCDFTIRVGAKEYKTHKFILAASSDYFRAMFASDTLESTRGWVDLKGVLPSAIEAILNYFYTLELFLTDESVPDILVAASLLQIDAVQDICVEYVQSKLNQENCISIAEMAERCCLIKLADEAFNLCLDHFKNIVGDGEFCNIEFDLLVRIISHDKLYIDREIEVYSAVLKWIEHNVEERAEKFESLLKHVRFPFIDPVDIVTISEHYMTKNQPGCAKLIYEVLKYFLLRDYPTLQEKYANLFDTRPRDLHKHRQRLYAVGGWIDKFKSIADGEVYNPRTNSWEDIPPMTQKRCGVGLVSLAGSLYAVGGHDGQSYLSSVERFDVNTKRWFRDVAGMKYTRTSVGVVALDGYIYAVGGQVASGATDRVERYDPANDFWSECASLRRRRLGAGVTVLGGFIYAVGGSDGSNVLGSVERYDPKMDAWCDVTPMQVPRKHLGCCSSRGLIFAVGGWYNDELRCAETYCPKLNEWKPIRPMNVMRCGIGLVDLAGKVYAIGGRTRVARLKEVEAYDPDTDVWILKQSMKQGRLGGGFAVHPM